MASYKIALESEAKAIGGSTSSVTTNKCCTKARAQALGCNVSGTYDSNQLVPKDHLSKKVTQYTITFKTTSDSASFYLFFNFCYTCWYRNAVLCICGTRKYSYCYSHR